MSPSNIAMLFAILLCIIISAFFSATETAFSTVNTIRLKYKADKGNKKAKKALYITDNYDKAITTILIGNNIANIACSSIATVVCINLFGNYGAAISTGVVTLLILTFGEITPKCVARENAEPITLHTASILKALIIVFSPLVFLFIQIKTIAIKMVKKDSFSPSVTEGELKVIIENSQVEGVLEQQERELVQSALDFDETTVQEILTPRVDVTAIDIDDSNEVNTALILKERYSRIPVYKDSIDNIVGILHARDYLEELLKGKTPNISKLMQPPYFVYKTKKLSTVLSDFKHKKFHIAIVADDYGGTLGIVTMEDLLEEIVGDIWDEDEIENPDYREIDPATYIVNGDMTITDLLELLGLREDFITTDSVSVGGWVMENLGDIPHKEDGFLYKNTLSITVVESMEQRITKVKVVMLPNKDTDQ